MRRRTILLGTFGLATATYGGIVADGAFRPCSPFEIDNPVFASAQKIGMRLITSGFEVATVSDEVLNQFQAELPARASRDFAANKTVQVDGWVLSQSEAEYCVHCARLSKRS